MKSQENKGFRGRMGGESEGQHSGNCGWPSSPHHSTNPRSEMCLIVPPLRTCVYPFRMSGGA